jgi:carbon-monoxide dehydrogenase medium subunit
VLAGGTDLIVRLRRGQALPRIVIDLKRVSSLHSGIVETGAGLRVGALVMMSQIIEDERMRHHFPALVEAARVVGSVQIRNRATLAGNICNASPAADTAPPLLIFEAVVNLFSKAGRRAVPVAEFLTGPGRTALDRGEIVESIDLPLPPRPSGAAFGRVTRRYGVDLATINLCCLVTASGEARLAYGAAGPRPFLVRDDSGVLTNADGDPGAWDPVLRRLLEQASPISDVRSSRDYRQAMLLVMSRRALRAAIERMRNEGTAS